MNYEIGKITKEIIKVLKLDYEEEMPIYIDKSNINHIREKHPKDFKMYGNKIKDIIKDQLI